MEIYHDSELEDFEKEIQRCIYLLQEFLSYSGALNDPDIREMYTGPVSELDAVFNNMGVVIEHCKECRVKFHQHPEFVRIYLEAYGDYHPDSEEYNRMMVEVPPEQETEEQEE